MELILSICLGIGLAAACGFRVFIPLFLASLLSYFDLGTFGITDSFEWIGSLPALITFGVASLVEVFAYYTPFVDNILDSVAIPLATISGTLITMSTMLELEPLVQWTIALIAGGGIAGIIKGSSAGTRLISSGTTGGLANPVVSTAETTASVGLSFIAWFFPFLAIILVTILLFLVYRIIKRIRTKKSQS